MSIAIPRSDLLGGRVSSTYRPLGRPRSNDASSRGGEVRDGSLERGGGVAARKSFGRANKSRGGDGCLGVHVLGAERMSWSGCALNRG